MSRTKHKTGAGYRRLRPGEILQNGDEFAFEPGQWCQTRFTGHVVPAVGDKYRRKVATPKTRKPKKPAPMKLPTLHLHWEPEPHWAYRDCSVSHQLWLGDARYIVFLLPATRAAQSWYARWIHDGYGKAIGTAKTLTAAQALCTKHLNAMLSGMVKHNLKGKHNV